MNLKNAYYHIKIKINNEWKIAFRTRYEFFEYAMMIFELTNASTIFQFLMNKIFAKLMNKLCILFLNDIFIYFRTKKKHWRHVRTMLKRLRKFNFFVNLIKCKFMQQSIEFLNYIINNKNIFMNMKRVDSIKSWSIFNNCKELQVFLDFANFYRKFIVKYAKMSRSLFELFKDNKNEKQIDEFVWNEEIMTIFKKFTRIFIEIFMLIHFDSNNQTMIEIDVSNFAIAKIIFQLVKSFHIESQKQWHSIVFYSRKMIFVEIKYSTHDQKLFVIVESFKQWRYYLKNNQFTITMMSNYNNLKYFMFIISLNKQQIKWVLLLSEYDFEIKYRNESLNFANESFRRSNYENENENDDICLFIFQNKFRNIVVTNIAFSIESKNCEEISDEKLSKENSQNEVVALTQTIRRKEIAETCEKKDSYENSSQKLFNKIEKLQLFDTECVKRRAFIRKNKKFKSWTLNSNNILRYWHAIYVLNETNLKIEILKRYHDDSLTKHFEIEKIVDLI